MGQETIKIGVLFSQTGPMSVTENAHIKGIVIACEAINANGGIDGKLVEPIILNPEGDDQHYAALATDLMLKHQVNAIFGCCLSASRKAVLPIIERFNGILFYPSVYEGFEYSPNVIYGGAVPNQVVVPLLEYIFAHYGTQIALVGSDTLYAREVNRIVSEFVAESGGTVVEELYFPFGTNPARFDAALKRLAEKGADTIVSTVVGEDSITLYNAGVHLTDGQKHLAIASLTTTETELARMKPEARSGHISALPYFGSLETPQNAQFVATFQKRYGQDCVPSVYSEACYALVHLFADAVRQSGSLETDAILAALSGAVFKGPGGDMFVDMDTNHFALRPHVGKSNSDGHFEVVWRSAAVVRPDPYLISYDRSLNNRVTR
ncbi:transporter substrate-binding domain-containing protein [Ochrobactrum chromiisoli]|uniref:Transporter substrate-binding domain-containing protein n=1 Tax=Ochrobactrum chromiisoli TaxID=2993941 RepID=A0ABT3QSS5_9HYPH|nr:transporter substrate-binding domain-containing protein [Ochrobactrum chromiisoli]MCX2698678.1 transporter substrate-binding domain-containing protein [Ochrobactrum chromiisoli]